MIRRVDQVSATRSLSSFMRRALREKEIKTATAAKKAFKYRRNEYSNTSGTRKFNTKNRH